MVASYQTNTGQQNFLVQGNQRIKYDTVMVLFD